MFTYLHVDHKSVLNRKFLCLGNNIAFVYPDMETVLIGHFENQKMIAAKPSKIIAERCNRGIKEIKISKPKPNAPTLKYERPNSISLGNQPKVMDPLDQGNIYIKVIGKTGDGGLSDGVFAKKNFTEGDIIAYYSGLLWNTAADGPIFTRNQTEEEM